MKDNDGRSALMNATLSGHKEIVLLLLQNGADANTQDNSGLSSLMMATHNGHTEIASLLLNNNTEFFRTDKSNHPDKVSLQLDGTSNITIEWSNLFNVGKSIWSQGNNFIAEPIC